MGAVQRGGGRRGSRGGRREIQGHEWVRRRGGRRPGRGTRWFKGYVAAALPSLGRALRLPLSLHKLARPPLPFPPPSPPLRLRPSSPSCSLPSPPLPSPPGTLIFTPPPSPPCMHITLRPDCPVGVQVHVPSSRVLHGSVHRSLDVLYRLVVGAWGEEGEEGGGDRRHGGGGRRGEGGGRREEGGGRRQAALAG